MQRAISSRHQGQRSDSKTDRGSFENEHRRGRTNDSSGSGRGGVRAGHITSRRLKPTWTALTSNRYCSWRTWQGIAWFLDVRCDWRDKCHPRARQRWAAASKANSKQQARQRADALPRARLSSCGQIKQTAQRLFVAQGRLCSKLPCRASAAGAGLRYRDLLREQQRSFGQWRR